MRACLVLCVAAALVGAACAECSAYIDGECYHKQRLLAFRPLDIDREGKLLYFNDGNRLRVCQLDTQLCNTTSYAWHVLQLTVDQRNGDIYGVVEDTEHRMGAGIYKLDLVNNEKELLVAGGAEFIKFKDKLYYTAHGNIMYTFENGTSERVAGSGPYMVHSFVVDKNDDIYFKSELYEEFGIRRLSKGVIDESVRWETSYLMTVDRDGNAVFFDPKSGTVYRALNHRQIEIGTINEPIHENDFYNEFTLNNVPVFDRDNNIIYRNNADDYIHLKRESTISIETTTSSTPAGNTEDYEDRSSSSPAPESAAGTPDESGPSPSGAQQAPHTGDKQQSKCSCQCPKLPNITIKVEFN